MDNVRRIGINGNKIADRVAKAFRVITLPPIAATAMLLVIYFKNSALIGGVGHLLLAVAFLGILPILAYPCQPFIKGFKDKGREGQRNLAMVFAFIGYLLGCVTALLTSAPSLLWILYLDYLLSGIGIILFNKVFHLRASGHGCGIAGPVAVLAYLGAWGAVAAGVLFYAASFWASVRMKRHTWQQLIGGSLIPVVILIALVLIF